ncbi:MAG: nucleotidyltransferase domain-containing protein [Candidatus Aenigmarchaeota archaeon]|nr:nucleotidyltransferase domain-containing protein [Candidatus Aenigmarchaeota archaeon]
MKYDLETARKVAEEFAEKYRKKSIGIIFHGALARGYFDKFADIDIIIVGERKMGAIPPVPRNGKFKGFVIDYYTITLKEFEKKEWPMTGRLALSEAIVYHDPTGAIKEAIKKKARFNKGERKFLMIEGIIQSEWFCKELPKLWVHRGDIVSAHAMFDKGMQFFYQALFAYNNRLVPYEKWRLNYARKLPWLPERFDENVGEVYLVKSLTPKELGRRTKAFMRMWEQLAPRAEKETRMSLKQMDALV